jgi:hypothetical protein
MFLASLSVGHVQKIREMNSSRSHVHLEKPHTVRKAHPRQMGLS